jgi:hypothetical protein
VSKSRDLIFSDVVEDEDWSPKLGAADELTASMEEQIEVEKQLQEDVDLDDDILDDVELDKIVEQEMKTNQGREDQRKLKEIIQMTNQNVEVKTTSKPEDKFSNSKAANKQSAEDEEIDEFIKKHLEDDKANEAAANQ